MKISKTLLILALMSLVFSCSKDDDAQPQVEQATLSFSKNSPVVEVPQGLMNSDDPNAQMAAGWIAMANGLSANLALFTPPQGAIKKTELITPANGRTTADKGVVYIWEDVQYGSVAYQIRDAEDKYIFELFYKGLDDSDWYRYLYAQEMKDRSAGYMSLQDAWGMMDDSREAVMMRWDWTRKGDIFTFKMADSEGGFNFTLSVNTKTKAGSVVYFEGALKISEVAWDAQGKGSWKQFDDTGAVVEEGTWN